MSTSYKSKRMTTAKVETPKETEILLFKHPSKSDITKSEDNNEQSKHPTRGKSARHEKRRLDESESKTVKEFLKNPEYTEYRESNKFKKPEKLGRIEDCLYGCDFGILPMDLEWFIQAHPVSALIASFMLIISIILAVSSVGYLFRNIITRMPNTFSWRLIALTYLIQVVNSNGGNTFLAPNCSVNSFETNVQLGSPYAHFILVGPMILVQASSVVFLTWRSFKAYTFLIAVFFLRIQNWFLVIVLIHVCMEFIGATTSLKSEMVYQMKMMTPNGVSGWWARTQEHFKCCGINGPSDWNNLNPTFFQITGQMFPLSCCDPKKSASKCSNILSKNDVYTEGCYKNEERNLETHGFVLIAVIVWIIIVSIVLLYIFQGIESGSRRTWKKSNSAFDSKGISIETFGSVGIVSMDGRKHYSKLILRASDFNQYTDGIFDFKYDYEYDMEIQRGEEIIGRAVVETSNNSDRKLKLEMEFDELQGLIKIIY